jgi:hypothetical protein
LSAAQTELNDAEQGREWAQAVAPQEISVTTARTEKGLASVGGVTLLEVRKKEGKEFWTPVDQGVVYLTDRQVIFSGTKEVKFPYNKISHQSIGKPGLQLGVSSRKRSHVLRGHEDKIVALIAACQAVAGGQAPTAPFDDRASAAAETISGVAQEIADLTQAQQDLVRPPRPVSPAWAPLSAVFVLMMFGSALAGPDDSEPLASASTTTCLFLLH